RTDRSASRIIDPSPSRPPGEARVPSWAKPRSRAAGSIIINDEAQAIPIGAPARAEPGRQDLDGRRPTSPSPAMQTGEASTATNGDSCRQRRTRLNNVGRSGEDSGAIDAGSDTAGSIARSNEADPLSPHRFERRHHCVTLS